MPIFICYPNEKKKDVKIIADIHSSINIYAVEVIDTVRDRNRIIPSLGAGWSMSSHTLYFLSRNDTMERSTREVVDCSLVLSPLVNLTHHF